MMTWEELVAIHASVAAPDPVILKLYYDNHGTPIVYTTDSRDGNYIEVDPETFACAPMNVRVVNGQLQHLPRPLYRHRLVPSSHGIQCHLQDVAVIVADSGQYWNTTNYEQN